MSQSRQFRTSPTRARTLLIVIAYIASFILLDDLAKVFSTAPSIMPWYPGAGLNLALLFGLGLGSAPAVLLATTGAVTLNLCCQATPGAWIAMPFILTICYSVTAFALRRVLQIDSHLKSVRDIIVFIAVALAAPFFVGFLVVLDLRLAGLVSADDFVPAWMNFWVGDSIGIVAFAPFLLLHLADPVRELLRGVSWRNAVVAPAKEWIKTWLSTREAGETLAEAASLALVVWLVFATALGEQFNALFLCFLPLTWIAVRHGLEGATTGILVLDIGALAAASVQGLTQTGLVDQQIFMLALSVSGLYLGAVVSERRYMGDKLHAAEQQYQHIFESTSDGLIINDLESGTVVEANPAVCAMHGYTRDEFIGLHPTQFIHPDDHAKFAEFVQVAKEGGDFQTQAVDVRKDGTTFHVQVHGSRLMFGGKPHIMGVVRDVTNQVRAYQQLEERVAERTREIQRLYEEEQHRSEQFRVIHEVGQQVTSILSVDELIALTVKLIHNAFGYYHAHIGLVEGGLVTFKPGAGVWRDHPACEWCTPLQLKVGRDGACGWVAGTGEPLLIPDVTAEPRFMGVEGIRSGSALVLPLKTKGRVIGTLDVESDRLAAFDEGDVATLQALVNQVAVAIENARLYEQAERRARELQALYDADEVLYRSLSLSHVLDTLVERATELLHADKTTVMVWDKEREQLVVGAARGFRSESLAQMSHSLGEGITTLVFKTGQPVAVEDVSSDVRVARRITDPEGIQSLMHVPIMIGRETFGVFGVNYCERHSFGEEELRLLTTLAQRAAIAIQNARLFNQSQQAAMLEERQRLARELHDSVSQALYGIALGARTARTQLDRDPERAKEPLDYVLALSQAGLEEMRALIFELRPDSLESEGLVAALAKQAAAVRARHAIQVETSLGSEPDIPIEVKFALYRIAQEALQNTIKHARATAITLRLQYEGASVVLEVGDNGRGFDPQRSYPGHMGLVSMQERAAKAGGVLELRSGAGAGTCVRVEIPASQPVVAEDAAPETA